MIEPSMRLCFVLLVAFAAATFLSGPENLWLAAAELALTVALFIYTRISNSRRRSDLLNYIESLTYNVDAATKDNLVHFPMPMVMVSMEGNAILYSNQAFLDLTGEHEHFFEISITDVIPSLPLRWLAEGKTECPELVRVGERKYRIFGNMVRTDESSGRRGYTATLYWVDVTEYINIWDEYLRTRPVFAIITMDNYDEVIKGLTEKDKSAFLSTIDDRISAWTDGCGGYLSKYDRDRYIFIFEERYLNGFTEKKFSLLESVRVLTAPNGIQPTLSIGLGKDGKDMAENFQFATLGLDMALSRGGDQAVIKNKFNFEFYGGHSAQMEKHTKVKSRVMANTLAELIRDASTVFIMGHKYADMDSAGAAAGLCCAARTLGKSVRIVLDPKQNAVQPLIDRMTTLPEYRDVFISPEQAIVDADGRSVLIVVDTNRPEQVESETLLLSCNKVAVIDHHRRAATYIQNAALNFHEPYASSAAELVTELLQYMVEPGDILRFEAEALLAGIVLDTKNFTIRTGSRTFDAAAFLRRTGADTTEVKKLLQSDIQTAMARYSIVQRAKIYRTGIAIAAQENVESRIVAAQAADELLNISGIEASFVLSGGPDAVNISARSMGEINVQLVLEKLGGGGNRSTAGAQMRDTTLKDAVTQLLAAIDAYLQDAEDAKS